MTTFTTMEKVSLLGRTAVGLEFKLKGVASALTLYWLPEQRSLVGNMLLSGGRYAMRLATAGRTIWFGQAAVNDPIVIKNAFREAASERDLTVLILGPTPDIFPTPEMLENGEAVISIVECDVT